MTNLSTVFPDKVVFLAPFVNVYPPTSDIWWRQKETLNAKQNKQTKWRRVQGHTKYRKLVVITNGSLPQVISSSAQPSYSNAPFLLAGTRRSAGLPFSVLFVGWRSYNRFHFWTRNHLSTKHTLSIPTLFKTKARYTFSKKQRTKFSAALLLIDYSTRRSFDRILSWPGVYKPLKTHKWGRGRKKWITLNIDLMKIWRRLISINWISSAKEINPIMRKSMSKLVIQPSFRALGQTHAKL